MVSTSAEPPNQQRINEISSAVGPQEDIVKLKARSSNRLYKGTIFHVQNLLRCAFNQRNFSN